MHSIHIPTPDGFGFRPTVYSHGWCELAPFALDTETWRLSYVFSGAGGRAIPGVMFEAGGGVRLEYDGPAAEAAKMTRDARHILRLDDDLSGLYETIGRHSTLYWIAEKKAGRMLRSPTVFEDLVKTLCTTNCSWGLTKIMVANLTEKLGPADKKGRRAFPSAQAMASVDEDFFRSEVRAGYRSPYFVELAQSVASGELDPESWLSSPLTTHELKKEMKKVKGVGEYAADNLLKLLGRYDGLALDSWLRTQFYKNHNSSKPCPDKKIERHYSKFGQWRGLVIWCDMTEKWIS